MRVTKSQCRHCAAGIVILAIFVFCVASLGFARAPGRVIENTKGFYGSDDGGLPAPDKVTLAGRENLGQAKGILSRQDLDAPVGKSSEAVMLTPIAMGEGGEGSSGSLDEHTGILDEHNGMSVESAAPGPIIPIPPVINPPSDLVGVFVPSTKPYVELTWKGNNSRKFLKEFRVYRSTGDAKKKEIIGTTKKEKFQDYKLQLGSTYIYWVTAVSKWGEESAPSNMVKVETFEDQPPEPPQGLVAAAIDPGVCLDWVPIVGPNIAGYMVYLVGADGKYKPLTKEPLVDNHYYHRKGVAGNLYAVCTVNLFGTESEYVFAEATVSQPVYF